MVHLVTYDLHQYGRNYEAIEALLSQADSAIHPMGSVWFIETDLSPYEWRDALMKVGDDNDEYFVGPLPAKQWASFNLNDSAVTWLEDPSRRW